VEHFYVRFGDRSCSGLSDIVSAEELTFQHIKSSMIGHTTEHWILNLVIRKISFLTVNINLLTSIRNNTVNVQQMQNITWLTWTSLQQVCMKCHMHHCSLCSVTEAKRPKANEHLLQTSCLVEDTFVHLTGIYKQQATHFVIYTVKIPNWHWPCIFSLNWPFEITQHHKQWLGAYTHLDWQPKRSWTWTPIWHKWIYKHNSLCK